MKLKLNDHETIPLFSHLNKLTLKDCVDNLNKFQIRESVKELQEKDPQTNYKSLLQLLTYAYYQQIDDPSNNYNHNYYNNLDPKKLIEKPENFQTKKVDMVKEAEEIITNAPKIV